MSVWLGACGGEDQPPALADYDGPDRSRSSTTAGAGGGSIPTPNEGAGGSSAASGVAGSSGSYIPTPVESEPVGMTGQAGASASPPVADCSLGTWAGNFDARSAADLQQLTGYTHVAGSLYVGTSSSSSGTDVTSLLALGCLEQVEGSVTILENPALRDLRGLEQLAIVGDDFTVSTNAQLRSLAALTDLVVTDVLHVRANPQLTLLSAGILSAGELYIDENAALPQCRAELLAEALGLLCNCEDNSLSDDCG
ncbi:MAG: hypothetical protein RL033_2581 [Pseudomonadota bacterium]